MLIDQGEIRLAVQQSYVKCKRGRRGAERYGKKIRCMGKDTAKGDGAGRTAAEGERRRDEPTDRTEYPLGNDPQLIAPLQYPTWCREDR